MYLEVALDYLNIENLDILYSLFFEKNTKDGLRGIR
jgi:hypothetical protein